MRRDRDDLRAVERQDAVQLGEANVVTDRQAELPVLRLRDDSLAAWLLRLRFAVDDAADLDVEQVDLAIDGGDLPARIEDDARVRPLLAPFAALDDRAADQRDSVRTRPLRHGSDRLAALERLRALVVEARVADPVPLLREHDDIGSRGGGLRDEPFGRFKVGSLVGATRHLHACDADSIGHGPTIALRS